MFCVYKMKSDRVSVIDYVWNISNAKHVSERKKERKKEKDAEKKSQIFKAKNWGKGNFLLPASLTQN